MNNYYEFLQVQPTASQAEIEAAWEITYHKWRTLVTHHDQQVVNQANQALAALDQARTILLDPVKRAAYDTGLGLDGVIGGLGDPDALLRQAGVSPSPQGYSSSSHRLDVWECPQCDTANPVGTGYCQKCGTQVGQACPSCNQRIYIKAQHCPECGANIEAATHQRMLEEQHQAILQRQEAERLAMLEPIKQQSDSAMRWATAGCILAFIPILNIAGFIASIGAIIKSRNALGMAQVIGDTIYRSKANKAFWLGVIPVAFYGLFLLLQVIATAAANR
ncbi:MAG: zinc ribbon domain-containing protein [Anaerolineae bacterium]|nr:zinc ribbon domain-containing protein [Anaerolineae bacterium]